VLPPYVQHRGLGVRKPLIYVVLVALCILIVFATVAGLLSCWEFYRHWLAVEQCVGVAYKVAVNLGGEEPETEAGLERAVAQIAESWNVFVRNRQGQLVDAWGTPFSVRVVHDQNHCKIVVRSAGPDAIMGNGDDLVYGSLFLKPRREGKPADVGSATATDFH
jgi:hypothetical protein